MLRNDSPEVSTGPATKALNAVLRNLDFILTTNRNNEKNLKVWIRLKVCSQGPLGRQDGVLFIQHPDLEWALNSVL